MGSSPEPMPSVANLIAESRWLECTTFPMVASDNHQRALTLWLLFITVFENDKWCSVLNPDFRDLPKWRKAIATSSLMKKDGEKCLADVIDEYLSSGDWQAFFENQKFLWKPSSPSSFVPYNLDHFKAAFRNDYVNPHPNILLDTIDEYQFVPGKSRNYRGPYYNQSFSIVQSSGMGKSRLVDEAAKTCFTFPFNLRENMNDCLGDHPPPDVGVREYFAALFAHDQKLWAKTRQYAFLEALFSETADLLKDYPKGTPEDIARRWYDWMDYGSTSMTVGTNRTNFYNQVIIKAKEIEGSILEGLKREDSKTEEFKRNASTILWDCKKRLTEAVDTFTACLQGLHTEETQRILAVIYFDEAHALHRTWDYNSYHILMKILADLVQKPIFFVFLSTDPVLNKFAERLDPQYRTYRAHPIPPFFELPFDCFCANFTSEAMEAGKLTLDGVCELGQVIKFGRPIWYAHFQTLEEDKKHLIIELARLKLADPKWDCQLAALDCRVLLWFDESCPQSRTIQAELIKSYMRVVFNIATTQDSMRSGYPSDPMLAEAAGWLLDGVAVLQRSESKNDSQPRNSESYDFIGLFPGILEEALQRGLLARGGRGKLVIRTLLTVAHDLTIKEQHPTVPNTELRFHRPIKLLDLLKNLCSEECWKTIRSATPREAFQGNLTLEEAFKDAWINFSHFVQLGDFSSFNLKHFSELLKRGAAVQTFDNQPDWDGAIPLCFGDPATTVIDHHSTSALLLQDRSERMDIKVSSKLKPIEDRDINNLPVVSIVFKFGVETHSSGALVTVDSTVIDCDTSAGNTHSKENSVRRRHYMITLYGCTSKTYKCIPEDSEIYRTLLTQDSAPNEGVFHSMVYNQAGSQMTWL